MPGTGHRPARFSLDEDKARRLLGEALTGSTGAQSPIGPDYCPAEGSAYAARNLIVFAYNAGLITGPGEIGFDYTDDEHGTGYSWMVTLGEAARPLQLVSLYTDISHLGNPAARGRDAALAVLAEARAAANDVLDILDRYASTLPGTVYVLEHADPKTGTSIDLYPTAAQADAALADLARQNWSRLHDARDAAALDDSAVTGAYLTAVDGTGEYATIHQFELPAGGLPGAAGPRGGQPDDNSAALDAIADLMDGHYWDTETVMAIAAEVRGTGRQVREDDEWRNP